MRGAASDLAVESQRHSYTSALLTKEALPPTLQPQLRLPSLNTDSAPSVVLVGPAQPTTSSSRLQREPTSGSAIDVGGDDAKAGHLMCNTEALLRQQQHLHQGALGAGEMGSSQEEVEIAMGQESPAMMSRCPRSPSIAAGRYEEATQAGVGSGHFSPTWFYKLNDAVASGLNANPRETETTTQMDLQKDLDEAAVCESGSGPLAGEGVEGPLRDGVTEFSAVPPCFRNNRLLADCTNVDCPPSGGLKASLRPAGMNLSQHSMQKDRCLTQYRKDSSVVSSEGFKQTLEGQLSSPPPPPPPSSSSSFSVTEGEGSETPQTRVPHETNVCSVGKKHWVLDEDNRNCGEVEEEPMLLSVLLDRGCGKRYEEEAAFWKHRCALAEKQLTVALGDDREACFFKATRSLPQTCVLSTPEAGGTSQTSSRPCCLDGIHLRKTLAPGQTCFVCHQMRKGKEGITNEEAKEVTIQIEGHRFAVFSSSGVVNQDVASTTTTEEKNRWILEEECGQMQETLDSLSLECETVKGKLVAQVVRNENLETTLLAKEEQQMAQHEQWLAQENKLRGNQEKLATALRQVHRNLAGTTEKLEEKDKELRASRERCCVVEAELAELKVEVVGLRDASAKRLEEGQQLQQQLEQLETEMRLCNTDMMGRSSIADSGKTETCYKGCNKDGTTLSDALRKDTEQRLQGVLSAMHCGEARHEWIVSQLLDTVKLLVGTNVEEEVLLKVDNKLQQLVQSLEELLKFQLDTSHNEWNFPPDKSELFEAPQASIHDESSVTDLVSRAQERMSQLVQWSSALQRRHSELIEELEVVRADRNELVGRQNMGTRHLQQLLLSAEQEKTRLTILLGERDETIWKLNGGSSLAGNSLKQPTRSSRDSPSAEAQVTGEEDEALHGMHIRDLKRFLLYVGQQTDIFADSLHALFMETLVAMTQTHRDQQTRAEAREAAIQKQLQHLCEEGAVRQRTQEESLDVLRAQLKRVQNELVDKEGALRTLLQCKLRQGEQPRRSLRNEEQPEMFQHLMGASKSPLRGLTSSPPLGDEKRGEYVSTGLVSVPPHAASSPRAACASDDGVQDFHGADRSGAVHESPSSLVPGAFAGHNKRGQGRQLHSSQHLPGRQCHPLPNSGALALSFSLSSGAAYSLPTETSDSYHRCSSMVQRGMMRKHQEVWMRQAELMGLVSDEERHDGFPHPITLLRSRK
ncbi:hypothetical protein TraAM80_01039 [Trypanosoma rangeli]|uniref:Uncharacterized protein n=1 Tax=Trypanosoma rangeli TaxID=5698 RepID=A0A422P0N1_TRYRA|nr:uncharacterized protein TraAM80_01039 [Trypanosoma rangeli]RNF11251.1 hypothetical protein TraAM80_01039 [Trypanosoma rangeli]|eukprot:RNF11251.1 hypothetical protein TraAM80_01039 [Trypanosoma rangeli]